VLDRVLAIGKAVLAEGEVDGVLTAALDGMIELVGAERGMVLLFHPQGMTRFQAARKLEREDLERPEFEVSRTVIERVRETGEGFWSANVLEDPEVSDRQSVLRLGLLSVICQPIRRDGETFGVVYLDHRRVQKAFDRRDAAAAASFAELISVAAANALERRRLRDQVAELEGELRGRFDFEAIVGNDPAMVETLELVGRIADTDATVLVRGESGTGKELVARALHANSRRRGRPFVAVNCAALPETLLEAELFGHVRGAFTGAVRDNPGWFERARGGTLFLDEIGELTPALQAKLLRVLDTGELSRVGGTRVERADVRLVAATHQDLEARVADGGVREDFLYRLKVLEVRVPPLRERKGDLPALARHLLAELTRRHGRGAKRLSKGAEARLLAHDYPGNVRELRNALERAVLVSDGEVIEPSHLPAGIGRAGGPGRAGEGTSALARSAGAPKVGFAEAKRQAVASFESDYVRRCLAETGGNISAAARLAGIDYKNFYTKVKRYRIEPASFKEGGGGAGGDEESSGASARRTKET